ncbi:MAG TPA: glycosyltransferase, partial [Caldithrix sp.]|nr:glycosyltransferase [Caldithrix sp.]
MDIISLLFITFSVFYISVILWVIIGLSRLRIKYDMESNKKISIVIAARNEEKRIRPTLRSLEKINYPRENFEVIIVDDDSSDNTVNIIEAFTQKYNHWKLIRLKREASELRGKKRALNEAINQSRYDIIFTTDADCMVPPNWLNKMSAYFNDKVDMVIGHSPLISHKGLWYKILEFDNLFSAISGSAPAKMGFALSSVGRNLAYRKSIYESIGGFKSLKKFRSGDDVHLTERFRAKNNKAIDYCADPDTFVMTIPPSTKKDIFHQQIRKNSKTLKKSWPTVFFSIGLFIFYMLFLTLPFFYPKILSIWFGVIIFKFVVEFIAIYYAALIFRKKQLI